MAADEWRIERSLSTHTNRRPYHSGKPAGRHQNIYGRAKRPFYGFGPLLGGHQTARAPKDASGLLLPTRLLSLSRKGQSANLRYREPADQPTNQQ